MKTLILGGPKTGKTTFANNLGEKNICTVFHTDDLMHLHWSEASEKASEWFDIPGNLIIEGTMAVRALRKWIERNKNAKPNFEVYFLTEIKSNYDKAGQAAMAKGVKTVFDEIKPALAKAGIKIHYDLPRI